MKTFIWAVSVSLACAGLSSAADSPRSSSRGVFSRGKSTSSRASGVRGRSSFSPGTSRGFSPTPVRFTAPTRSFTRMDAPSTPPTPQQYGVPAPVEGATLRNLGFQQGPGSPYKEHAFEAGPIAYEDSKGRVLDTTPGARLGPGDKAPPPNPGSVTSSGGASGGNAITPNAPLQTIPPATPIGQ